MSVGGRRGDVRGGVTVIAAFAVALGGVAGCGGPHGVEVVGSVTRPDGRAVNVGEIWLEPKEGAGAGSHPVRRPIRDGRYVFEPAAGVLPGPWLARVQAPPLGPGASAEEIASAFRPVFRTVTVRAAGDGANAFDFTIEPAAVPVAE